MRKLISALLLYAALIAPVFARTKLEPSVPVRTVAPDCPDQLRREGVRGLVMVKCEIDASGNVAGADAENSGNAVFGKNAVAALRKGKFQPAKLDAAPAAESLILSRNGCDELSFEDHR